ncbi:hypothetical protein D3C81_2006630 [compost metagenome]
MLAERQHLYGDDKQRPADQQQERSGFLADSVQSAGLNNLRNIGDDQSGIVHKPGHPGLLPVQIKQSACHKNHGDRRIQISRQP